MSSDILGDPGAVSRGGKNGATEFFTHLKTGHGTLGSQRMVVGTMTQQLIFPPPTTPPDSFDMLGSILASSKLYIHPPLPKLNVNSNF